MKYYSTLPFSALLAVLLLSLLTNFGVLPSGDATLKTLQTTMGDHVFWLCGLIILLESIVYVGFYFPGQFFAVLLVVAANPDPGDIVWLTLSMVVAATLGSLINFQLGKWIGHPGQQRRIRGIGPLLLAMIHINSLAFFMFAQGAGGRSRKIVLLAGLMNLPYYLLLIAVTAFLSEEIMLLAESTGILLSMILVWLVIAVVLDIRKRMQKPASVVREES